MDSTEIQDEKSHQTFRVQEEGVNTDQNICHCDCQEISMYKEKAHKAFMQVNQIESLFHDEVEQIREFYEDRLKSSEKKNQYKEDFATEKFQEYQSEIRKLKQCLKSQEQINAIDSQYDRQLMESFETGTINLNEESIDSSAHIVKDLVLVLSPNDQIKRFKEKFEKTLQLQFKRQSPKNDLMTMKGKKNVLEWDEQIKGFFEWVKEIYDLTVSTCQKYNTLVREFTDLRTRYDRKVSQENSLKKQAEFMSEHIKKISQDKLRLEKRCNELEKNHKTDQETMKKLRGEICGSRDKKTPSKHRFQLYEDQSQEGTIEVEGVSRKFMANQERKLGSRALNLHKRQEKKLKEGNLKGPEKDGVRNHS